MLTPKETRLQEILAPTTFHPSGIKFFCGCENYREWEVQSAAIYYNDDGGLTAGQKAVKDGWCMDWEGYGTPVHISPLCGSVVEHYVGLSHSGKNLYD